jgi:hypothetical protein
VNPPFDQPFSFFIAERFKIVDGKINRIEALVTPVPVWNVDRLVTEVTNVAI